MPRSGLKRLWDLAVVAVGAALLLSMGGAIVAAPLTLPFLYLAIRAEPGRAGVRAAAVAVAALTVAEIAWAATYLAMAEAEPWIWLIPVVAAAGTAAVVGRRPGDLAAA